MLRFGAKNWKVLAKIDCEKRAKVNLGVRKSSLFLTGEYLWPIMTETEVAEIWEAFSRSSLAILRPIASTGVITMYSTPMAMKGSE